MIVNAVALLLSVILGKQLTVDDIKTQYNIQNLQGRSARLDIKARDTGGNVYNCEVENANNRAIPERARYNGSLIDASELVNGEDWNKLPDTYVIMITRNDVLGGGKQIYHIEKTIKELDNKPFGDRSYIIYVNSKIQDNTELGKLMHDFHCDKAEDIYNRTLAERVEYFKDSEKGEIEMCEIMDKLITKAEIEKEQETNLKAIKNMVEELEISPQKAMQILKIDTKEQDNYLALLGLKM